MIILEEKKNIKPDITNNNFTEKNDGERRVELVGNNDMYRTFSFHKNDYPVNTHTQKE